MPPRSWQRAWKTARWPQLLSGVTCDPSTASRGVESWIGALRDSRVSPSPPPGSAKGKTTRATSGPTSPESFAKWNRRSRSWKTCRGSRRRSAKSSVTWPNSGSLRSGTCFRREEWERRTSAADGSASRGETSWPTPTKSDGEGGPGCSGRAGGLNLRTAVMFPTPAAQQFTSNRGGSDPSDPKGWSRNGRERLTLAGMARKDQWPTPRATDGSKPACGAKGGRHSPGTVVKKWPTPTAGDSRASGSRNLPGSKAHAGVSLTDAVRTGSSSTPRNGESGGGQLNPPWVAWLMAWPSGWTDCAPLETESFRLWRRGLWSCSPSERG